MSFIKISKKFIFEKLSDIYDEINNLAANIAADQHMGISKNRHPNYTIFHIGRIVAEFQQTWFIWISFNW